MDNNQDSNHLIFPKGSQPTEPYRDGNKDDIQITGSSNAVNSSCLRINKQPLTRSHRVFKTLCIVLCNVATGLCMGLSGPTLVHIEHLLGTDTQSMGFAYMGQNFGYFAGSILCGLTMQYFNPEVILSIICIWVSVCIAGLPWSPNVIFFGAVLIVKNVAYGYFDAGGESYTLQLWAGQRYQDPVFNLIQCAWTGGAFLASFLVLPFLSELPPDDGGNHHNSTSFWNSTETVTEVSKFTNRSVQVKSGETTEQISMVRYAYVIASALTFVISVLFIIARCLDWSSSKHRQYSQAAIVEVVAISDQMGQREQMLDRKDREQQSEDKKYPKYVIKRPLQIVVLTLLVGVAFLEAWVNNNFHTFVSALVIKGLNWDMKKGPLATSVFLCGELLGQIVGIPVSAVLHPRVMLLCNILFSSIAFPLMLLAAFTGQTFLFWIGVAMAGAFSSTIFGSTMLWGSHFVKVTPMYGSIFVIGTAFGFMSSAALTGYLFDNATPLWVVYIGVIASFTMLALFIAVFSLEKIIIGKNKQRGQN